MKNKTVVAYVVVLCLPLLILSQDPTSTTPADTTPIAAESEVFEEKVDAPPELGGSAKGGCECAVFSTESPEADETPILSQTPISVSCDPKGEDDCLRLCTSLAQAAKDRGPVLLCASLGHADEFKASVFSRTCNAPVYAYTGLTAPSSICCHNNFVVDCKSHSENKIGNIL